MRIDLTPDQIEAVGNRLKQSASEIQSVSQSANTQVDSIRSMLSPALQRNIDNWDRLNGSIREAVEVLNQIATEYVSVAMRNIEANR